VYEGGQVGLPVYQDPEEVCIQYHDEHNYSSLLYSCLSWSSSP
jgi:hypothetical protein